MPKPAIHARSLARLGLVLLALTSFACSDDSNGRKDASVDQGPSPDQTVDARAPDSGAPDGSALDKAVDGKPREAAVPDKGTPDLYPWAPDGSVPSFALSMGGSDAEKLGTHESTYVDTSGNTYLCAAFTGTGTFGNYVRNSKGLKDAVIIKVDAAGKVAWVLAGGGTGDDSGWGLTVDESTGSVFAVGVFSGTATFGSTTLTSKGGTDMFLAKLDSSGNLLWVKSFGGTGDDEANSVALSGGGGANASIYIAGYFEGSMTLGAATLTSKGAADMFLARLDSSGSPSWALSGGGVDFDGINSMAVHGDDAVVTGVFYKSAAIVGFNGTKTITTTGEYDHFVAKFDKGGGVTWAKAAASPSFSVGYAMELDGADNVISTGYYYDNVTFGTTKLTASNTTSEEVFVAKHSGIDGTLIWAVTLGGTGTDWPMGVSLDPGDTTLSPLITGLFNGTATFGATQLVSAGGEDAFVARLSGSTGAVQWAKRAGGTGDDTAIGGSYRSLAGTLLVTGLYRNTVTFGTTSLTSKGQTDLFVWKSN